MPTVIRAGKRRFRITCRKCDALVGFYAYEVKRVVRTTFVDTLTIDCPACDHEIEVPWNYKSTLHSEEIE